jgi:S1-C subfamily serine protease
MDELMLEIRRRQVGEKVAVKFYRGKDLKEVELTLEAKPSL